MTDGRFQATHDAIRDAFADVEGEELLDRGLAVLKVRKA